MCMIPRCNKCCCVFSLRTGCLVIGAVNTVFIFADIFLAAIKLNRWVQTSQIIMKLLLLAITFGFVYGVWKEIISLMRVYAWCYLIFIIIDVLVFVGDLIPRESTEKEGGLDSRVSALIVYIIEAFSIVLKIYFLLVIRSHIMKVREEQHQEQE